MGPSLLNLRRRVETAAGVRCGRRAAAALCLALGGSVACGDDAVGPPRVVGEYDLTQMGIIGESLRTIPATFPTSAGFTVQVIRGFLGVRPDNSFEVRLTAQLELQPAQAFTGRGTYTTEGTRVVFDSEAGSPFDDFDAELVGNSLRVRNDIIRNAEMVFEK